MKYFLDTEFSEKPGSIDLLSIGIVREDGKQFYAECSTFPEKAVHPWLADNVIPHLKYWNNADGILDNIIGNSVLYHVLTPAEITALPLSRKRELAAGTSNCSCEGQCDQHFGDAKFIANKVLEFIGEDTDVEFYGYFCDYDWVLFCWMFGTMVDLPDHFPYYCRDVKQLLDEFNLYDSRPEQLTAEHNALADAEHIRQMYEYAREYVREQYEQRIVDTLITFI